MSQRRTKNSPVFITGISRPLPSPIQKSCSSLWLRILPSMRSRHTLAPVVCWAGGRVLEHCSPAPSKPFRWARSARTPELWIVCLVLWSSWRESVVVGFSYFSLSLARSLLGNMATISEICLNYQLASVIPLNISLTGFWKDSLWTLLTRT